MLGTVEAFGDDQGHGTVRTDDGRVLFFHCTSIADGSRTVAVGARVALRVVPGDGGRWEATDVEAV